MYCPDTLFAFLFLFISITCFSLDCLLGTVSLLRCENKYTHTYIESTAKTDSHQAVDKFHNAASFDLA